MSDMTIPKQTKKMLLFVSTMNPFWRRAMKAPATQTEIAKFIGVAHGAIPNWKTGVNINASTVHTVFSETERRIKESRSIDPEDKIEAVDVLKKFRSSYEDDKESVYNSATILGMSIEQCQLTIDEVIYKRGPVFPGMYYSTRSAAEEYISQYKGTFLLWVRRNDMWLRCALRVRYVIEIGFGFVIRCKLNFPIIEDASHLSRTYWEYDGFLVRRPNRVFWLFEKRQRDRNDHFYFITGVGRAHRSLDDQDKKVLTLSGRYLTTGQDDLQSVVGDAIFLQHVETRDEERMIRLMHELPCIIREAEALQPIETLWKEVIGTSGE